MSASALAGVRRSRRRRRVPPALLRWTVVLAVLALLELLTRAETIGPLVMPPPTDIARGLYDDVQTTSFGNDVVRTGTTVAIAAVAGCALGIAFGFLNWRLPALWDALEPFLVSLYAMPLIVFYPIVVVLMGGLGIGPIALIASFMALVPATVHTVIALREVPTSLLRLGRSLNSTPWQSTRHILLPAAIPLAMPGIRQGCVYAMIGTVAMEFILADRGLGFRIGVAYRQFDVVSMWAGIVAVAVLAMLVNLMLSAVEGRLRRDMA